MAAFLDASLRTLDGAPTYLLTDNEYTLTIEHVAGVAVRHLKMVGRRGPALRLQGRDVRPL
ncbi:MAG: hypothetical protein H7270_13090 [Dermatophilaceae bacterium]|nr:hypothetical protein [Dermatophilaceae bacterium]